MVDRILKKLVVFAVIVLAICHGTELNSNEAEARLFLDETSDKLFSFYDDATNREFVDIDNSYDQCEAHRNDSMFLRKIIEDSRKFAFENFNDEELKYAFKVLGKEAGVKIIGGEEFSQLFDSLKELENLQKDEFIDNFDDSMISLPYSPDVENIIETSNDPKILEYYWTAWREITGEWAEDNLDVTLQALQEAANLTELSPLEFWLRDFNITDIEKMMTDIRPLYLELHAFVRNQLKIKYGEAIITPDGLIPDHLFRQISYQIMTNQSIIEGMFPFEGLPPVESALMDKFEAKQLYEIAEDFFENLGFVKYPSSIWGDRIRMSEAKDDECDAKVWYWTPNVYLEFCEQMDFWDFLDAYANMAYIYYAKEMVGLPAYYFCAPNSLDMAISKAVILSSSTHTNLKEIGLLPDYIFTEEVEMNRLLRKAIANLLYIPLDFVHAKLMADLMSGNVKKAEINNHYWQLMDQYAGVGPPEDHKSYTYDLPQHFYEEMNDNYMSSDFTTEILSYQLYKKLCELSGKYPKEPLHLCHINGSKEAGNALKKIMRLGVSKPFHEVLGSMFPDDPTIRAEGLLEYYKPIMDLLSESNKEANVKPDWKLTDNDK